MATITVTPAYTFTSGETVEANDLNLLGQPTVAVSNIANADVASNAAIAGTKVTPNFGSQTVSTTGPGSFASLVATGTAGSLTVSDSTRNVAASIYADNANHVNIEAFAANDSATKRNVCLAKYGGSVQVGTTSTLGNAKLIADLGVAAHADGAGEVPFLQVYNANAGTNEKTWRIGGFSDGTLQVQLVNDAYTSSASVFTLKKTGQARFVPQAADPAGAEGGDVYFNNVTNKLRVYNGTAWIDLH